MRVAILQKWGNLQTDTSLYSLLKNVLSFREFRSLGMVSHELCQKIKSDNMLFSFTVFFDPSSSFLDQKFFDFFQKSSPLAPGQKIFSRSKTFLRLIKLVIFLPLSKSLWKNIPHTPSSF